MRRPEYLSPSSLKTFYEDREEFYIRYLSPYKPPRTPQTEPMAIGSAFDAYVKSYLYEKLIGKDPRFELTTLFEAQVEKQCRDKAFVNGKIAFDFYTKTGALADLMLDLHQAVGEPRFETEIRGVIGDVMFLGKPDLFYTNKSSHNIILDWKVNGWYSRSRITPMPGYLKIREIGKVSGSHRDACIMPHNGQMINIAHYLEGLNTDWADQLSIYGWLSGEPVGGDFVVAIDQLVANPLRVAEHRLRIGRAYQLEIYNKASKAWSIIHSEHVFDSLTFEESKERCESLDIRAKELSNGNNDLFFEITR